MGAWSSPVTQNMGTQSYPGSQKMSPRSAPSTERSILYYDSLEQFGNSNMGAQSAPVIQSAPGSECSEPGALR